MTIVSCFCGFRHFLCIPSAVRGFLSLLVLGITFEIPGMSVTAHAWRRTVTTSFQCWTLQFSLYIFPSAKTMLYSLRNCRPNYQSISYTVYVVLFLFFFSLPGELCVAVDWIWVQQNTRKSSSRITENKLVLIHDVITTIGSWMMCQNLSTCW